MTRELFIVNVEVAVVRNGRYLAVTRGAGESYGAGWVGFPGGKLDRGDPIQDAIEETARREALEETGLEIVDPVVYIESHTFLIEDEQVLDIVVLARAPEGEPFASDPEEVSALAWLTYEELMQDQNVQPWTRASLELVEPVRQERGW